MTVTISRQGNREIVDVRLSDPRVTPMLEELAQEYSARYHDHLDEEELREEMVRYPAAEFEPPVGGLILILEDGVAVAGGAFRPRSEPELGEIDRGAYPHESRTPDDTPAVPTAELKRIWTHHAHRRKGLAAQVIEQLETRIRDLGYPRIYLTTGPRQPEAEGLYLKTGYTPLYEIADEYEEPLPFEKWLSAPTH